MQTDRRLVLAIVLMVLAVVVANFLFPGKPIPRAPAPGGDTTAVAPGQEFAPPPSPEMPPVAGQPPGPVEVPAGIVREGEKQFGGAETSGDTFVVRSALYEYHFTNRGAAMVGALLLSYESYAEGDPRGSPVQMIRPGDRILGYRVAVGQDTLDLRDQLFESDAPLLISVQTEDSLSFHYVVPRTELRFVVTYHFHPDRYLVEVTGSFQGIGERGYSVLTAMGRGLRTNEANPKEDLNELAYVTHDRGRDYGNQRLQKIQSDQQGVEGGPFRWVGVKNKYFLIGFISDPEGSGFGGMLVSGVPEPNAAKMEVALPVPAGSPGFSFSTFMGPQDFGRLAAVGQNLENVNPYGYRWMRPIIRPLVGLIMAVLVWMHMTFSLGYGWVLMLFGVIMRIVLFPLYQKSMRAQMGQMRVQPLIKEIQSKYKDDPQRLQKEMVRLYKEHNVNPLAGCLPMLLPMPILITLFFVFRNTIEVRGVPFLWLPDLSLKDPLYIIPILMGLSMFLLQWIGQRGLPPNPQMKMMGYAMPVIFTVLFLNFPSGLNLYYATSNFASLPQQLYLSGERRKAREKTES